MAQVGPTTGPGQVRIGPRTGPETGPQPAPGPIGSPARNGPGIPSEAGGIETRNKDSSMMLSRKGRRINRSKAMVQVGAQVQAHNGPRTGPDQARNRPTTGPSKPGSGPEQAQARPKTDLQPAQSRPEAGLKALGQVGRLGPDMGSAHLARWSQSQNPGRSYVVTRPCKMHGRIHALIFGPRKLGDKICLWGDIYVLRS
jgi:hypothetical protein